MPDLDPTLLLAAAASFVAALGWVGAAGANRRLADQAEHTRQLRQELELVRQSISGLTAGAVGMDRRVHRLEQREKSLSERQESFEIQQADEQPDCHQQVADVEFLP